MLDVVRVALRHVDMRRLRVVAPHQGQIEAQFGASQSESDQALPLARRTSCGRESWCMADTPSVRPCRTAYNGFWTTLFVALPVVILRFRTREMQTAVDEPRQ